MPWSPAQYERFKRERSAPFDDLLALVRVRPDLRVIDLGCGTGELTRRLADLLPGSDVAGIDASSEMLARSASFARPGLRFEIRRIEDVEGSWDLVVSNAALHWVADHRALVPRLLSLLAPGGQIVVQMPSNFAHATHVILEEVANESPFREAFGALGPAWTREVPVLPIEAYAELLSRHGAKDVAVLERVYLHELPDADALAEWMRGTALLRYLEPLTDEAIKTRFVERYCERLRQRFPERPVLFTFRRTFFTARADG